MNQPGWYDEYQKHNFFRLINWRWQEAFRLIETQKRRHEDPQTMQIAAFLRDREKKRRGKSYKPPAGLPEAFDLWEFGQEMRIDLEAYLLIEDQSNEQIAERFGLLPETIHWYEATFFNVRDRLEARGWVTSQAIPGRNRIEPAGPSYGPILRHYAYHGGVTVLETVISVIRHQALPKKIFDSFQHDPVYQDARLRFLIALHIRSLYASDHELAQLARMYRQASEFDQKQLMSPAVLEGDLSMLGSFFNLISKKPSRERSLREKIRNSRGTSKRKIKKKASEILDPTTASASIAPTLERRLPSLSQ